ncbi:MAG TPA: phosphoglucosamine mutase [Deltaproteobacteria bacterium]|nr:phosphoglucosamine mutase [Deltaproteobacteria bacterium]
MRPVAFGTDGIRGPAGTHPITSEVGAAVGRAACRLARALGGDRVVIARDTRPSGPELAAAVAAGVGQAGGTSLDAGVVPTSAVGLAVHAALADVGVMVTASHNPEPDNGFKILGAGGRKLDEAAVAAVEAWIAAEGAEVDGATHRDVADEVSDLWRRAVQAAVPDTTALSGRRFAVDLANGAGTAALPWLSSWLPGIEATGISGTINGGCGSEHLGALSERVVAQALDGGIALDGDADRVRLVDEAGRVVDGDAVIWLLARHLAAPAIAVTVMSGGALDKQLPGVRVVRTAVGDRHVRGAMDRDALVLGGERSGHVLFGDVAAGDGLIAGLRALVAAWSSHERLSGAFAAFKPLPSHLSKVEVRARPSLDGIPPLSEICAASEDRLGPHGRVLLRYSGTEPVLRILVEGDEADVVAQVAEQVASVARRVLG